MPAPFEKIASDPLIIPPPQVVWAWLSYFYQTTGEWVMPPVREEGFTAWKSSSLPELPVTSVFSTNEVKINLSENTCLSDIDNSSAQNSAAAKILNSNRQDRPFIAYQFPFPNLVAYAP